MTRLSARSPVLTALTRRCDHPVQLLVPVAAIQVALQSLPDSSAGPRLRRAHQRPLLTIGAVTWMVMAAIQGVGAGIIELHPANVADNLEARRVQTQTRVLTRIGTAPRW